MSSVFSNLWVLKNKATTKKKPGWSELGCTTSLSFYL